jgi:hypothetical protein
VACQNRGRERQATDDALVIHLLLVIAVIVVVFQFISGRRSA